MSESKTETAEKDKAKAKRKKGKTSVAGDRYRVELTKGEDRISISATPKSGGGYKVSGRQTKDGVKRPSGAKHFGSFDAAKAHVDDLVRLASEKGWAAKRKLSIEELF